MELKESPMASASFSITAVVQDVFQLTETAQQQAPATATPVNSNQAQNAPTPADTVTLTNETAQGQQTGQDTNPGRLDRAAILGAGAFLGANGSAHDRPAPVPTLPYLLPALQQQDVPAVGAAANAANTVGSALNVTA
jgi:hypothetical protein